MKPRERVLRVAAVAATGIAMAAAGVATFLEHGALAFAWPFVCALWVASMVAAGR